MGSEHESIHMSDPCHPGEVLRDWINGHGKTIQEAATLMGVSAGNTQPVAVRGRTYCAEAGRATRAHGMEQRRDVATVATGP